MMMGRLRSDMERLANVFKIVVLAELERNAWIKLFKGSWQGLPIIGENDLDGVVQGLQETEECEEGICVFGRDKDPEKNIVRFVINAVDERDFLRISFYLHVLPVHDENARRIAAEIPCEVDALWETSQFLHDALIHRLSRKFVFISEFTKRNSIDIWNPQWFFLFSMVNRKRAFTALTKISLASVLTALLNCLLASTGRTCGIPSFFSPYG